MPWDWFLTLETWNDYLIKSAGLHILDAIFFGPIIINSQVLYRAVIGILQLGRNRNYIKFWKTRNKGLLVCCSLGYSRSLFNYKFLHCCNVFLCKQSWWYDWGLLHGSFSYKWENFDLRSFKYLKWSSF